MEEKASLNLSEREIEILRPVCQGKTSAEIAEKLPLRTGTIMNTISFHFSKTSCVSRAQFARFSLKKRLIQ